jgi:hypothetical protein
MDTTAAGIVLPQVIQCRTCHSFHGSLDFENESNSALRADGAIELLMYRDAATPVILDFSGPSNLCANCHQPRAAGPDETADPNEVITQSSSRYGPHHGPQSTILAGIGAYEIGDGWDDIAADPSTHTQGTCVSCHMYEKDHAMDPSLDACNTAECHGGSPVSGFPDVLDQLDDLEAALITAGLLNADGSLNTGDFPRSHVGALYNYKTLIEDRSGGLHNPKYAKQMITNSLAVFN